MPFHWTVNTASHAGWHWRPQLSVSTGLHKQHYVTQELDPWEHRPNSRQTCWKGVAKQWKSHVSAELKKELAQNIDIEKVTINPEKNWNNPYQPSNIQTQSIACRDCSKNIWPLKQHMRAFYRHYSARAEFKIWPTFHPSLHRFMCQLWLLSAVECWSADY